ncbi:MAG: hypothetical protein WCK65_07325 [Rhodospirillaceae bacterium]
MTHADRASTQASPVSAPQAAGTSPAVGYEQVALHDHGERELRQVGCLAAAATKAEAEQVAEDLYKLDFAVHVSLRYHSRRRAWFDALHRLSMVLSAVGGSAALASVLTAGQSTAVPNSLVLVVAMSVTAAGAFSVAFGFSERARVANDLYRRFAALARDIAAHQAPVACELRKWRAERLLIEADEPSINSVINILCHNAEVGARGRQNEDEHIYWVHWFRRMCANLVSLRPVTWQSMADYKSQLANYNLELANYKSLPRPTCRLRNLVSKIWCADRPIETH